MATSRGCAAAWASEPERHDLLDRDLGGAELQGFRVLHVLVQVALEVDQQGEVKPGAEFTGAAKFAKFTFKF